MLFIYNAHDSPPPHAWAAINLESACLENYVGGICTYVAGRWRGKYETVWGFFGGGFLSSPPRSCFLR